MALAEGDFELTADELRTVVRFATISAREVLPVFTEACPSDTRPAAAIDAALRFVSGEPRTNLQRTAAFDAHRAAKDAPDVCSRLAAQAAGDAAAAAYLHPIAKTHQVGHILRATANAAHISELQAGGDVTASDAVIRKALDRAEPPLIDVLCRYPAVPAGKDRVAKLLVTLDRSLRELQ